MIHHTTGNNKDISEQALREQAAADRELFQAMRLADDAALYRRPMEDRLTQAIARSEARIQANRRILDEERHEGFLDDEWHARGMW